MLRKTLLALCILSHILFVAQKAESHAYSIAFVSDDKVYLHPETIHMTKQGFFIETSPDYFVSVPALFSDALGFYLPMMTMPISGRVMLAYCNRCEDWKEVYYPSKFCPSCGLKIIDSWNTFTTGSI